MIYLTKQLAARIAGLQKILLHSQLQFNLKEDEFKLFQSISQCNQPLICFTESLNEFGIAFRLERNTLVVYSEVHKKSNKAVLDLAILLEALPDNAYDSWNQYIKKV
jgi:hypothetical protein